MPFGLSGESLTDLEVLAGCAPLYCTSKGTPLESVPPGVTTLTVPVGAPAGTVVVISVAETTLKTAAVPLKLTLVAPVRLVPRIRTAPPTAAILGTGFTNRPRPTERLKSVPSLVEFPPFPTVP